MNEWKFTSQLSEHQLFLWETTGSSADGRHEWTCSTFTNACSSHWLRQLHADKVLVLHCSSSEPQKGFFPKLKPPTEKWKDQWMVEMQGGIRRVDRDGGKHSRCFLLLMTAGVSDGQLQVCKEYFCIWWRVQHDEKPQWKGDTVPVEVFFWYLINLCWNYNHLAEILLKAQMVSDCFMLFFFLNISHTRFGWLSAFR